MSSKSDVIHFCLHDLIHVYRPGAGAVSPRGQNFDVNRKVLHVSLYPFVASFKKMSLKSDFIHFFHDLIHVVLVYSMLHTKFQGHRTLVPKKKIFKVFTIYGHGGHLGHVT